MLRGILPLWKSNFEGCFPIATPLEYAIVGREECMSRRVFEENFEKYADPEMYDHL